MRIFFTFKRAAAALSVVLAAGAAFALPQAAEAKPLSEYLGTGNLIVEDCPYCGETHELFSSEGDGWPFPEQYGSIEGFKVESSDNLDVWVDAEACMVRAEFTGVGDGTGWFKVTDASDAEVVVSEAFDIPVIDISGDEEALADSLDIPGQHPAYEAQSKVEKEYVIDFSYGGGISAPLFVVNRAIGIDDYQTLIDGCIETLVNDGLYDVGDTVELRDGELHELVGWDIPVDTSATVSASDFVLGDSWTDETGIRHEEYVLTIKAQWEPEVTGSLVGAYISSTAMIYLDLAQADGAGGSFVPQIVVEGDADYYVTPVFATEGIASFSYVDGRPVLTAMKEGYTPVSFKLTNVDDSDNVVETQPMYVQVYDSRVNETAGEGFIANAEGFTLTYGATSDWNAEYHLVSTHLGNDAAQAATDSVVAVVDGVTGHPYVFDIHLADSWGNETAIPGGRPVTVTAPIPEGLSPENLRVFHVADDGTVTDMNAIVDAKAGTVSFETTHFSTFVFANVEVDDEQAKPAGEKNNTAEKNDDGLAKTGDVSALPVLLATVGGSAALLGARALRRR